MTTPLRQALLTAVVATVYTHDMAQGGSGNGHYGGKAEVYMDVGDAMGNAILEKDISLPRGNIFHRDLDFPFLDEDDTTVTDRPRWGAETDNPHIYLAGAGARRGGGVSGIAGHNAAMAAAR